MENFEEFLEKLGAARWNPAGYIDESVLDLLRELSSNPGVLHRQIASWASGNLELRGLRSHETATHYKWFIYYHEKLTYRVWLHQYKPASERTLGYAEVPHNHRYSLASYVVTGGFDHHVFRRKGQDLAEVLAERTKLGAGDAYLVHCDQVHKLSGLQEHTLTVVVESPVVRHYSEAFYGETYALRRIYDFVGMHSGLCEATHQLGSCGKPPAGERAVAD